MRQTSAWPSHQNIPVANDILSSHNVSSRLGREKNNVKLLFSMVTCHLSFIANVKPALQFVFKWLTPKWLFTRWANTTQCDFKDILICLGCVHPSIKYCPSAAPWPLALWFLVTKAMQSSIICFLMTSSYITQSQLESYISAHAGKNHQSILLRSCDIINLLASVWCMFSMFTEQFLSVCLLPVHGHLNGAPCANVFVYIHHFMAEICDFLDT